MPEFKVLEDGQLDSSTCNNSIKLQYLSQEKNRMEVELEQLKLNNKILRNINADLAKGLTNIDLTELLARNKGLQQKLESVCKQRQQLVDQIFILNQIRMEGEKEQQQITSNYEQKIIQLRRSIQFKEGVLQKAESQGNINQDFQEIVLPPYNVSMHFYEEFQEYKSMNKILKESNLNLKEENQMLISQNNLLATEVKKLSSLANSQCSFIEYRTLLNEDRVHSLPHKAHKNMVRNVVSKEKKEKEGRNESNELTGNTFSEFTNKKNMTLRRIIKKMQIQNAQLKEKTIALTVKNKQLTKSMQTLIQSNKFYQKGRNSQNQKLEGYRMEAQRYKKVLLRRRQYLRCLSVSDKIWCELRPPPNQNEQIMQKRKAVTDQLKKAKQKFQSMPDPRNKIHGRSNSCIFDYNICLKEEDEGKMKRKENGQFNRMIGDDTIGFENDFSIIAGGKKLNYAELKKKKEGDKIVKVGGFLEEIF